VRCIEPEDATGEAAELLAIVREELGLGPTRALRGGVLPVETRERIALLVAQESGSDYGLSAHTFIGTLEDRDGLAETFEGLGSAHRELGEHEQARAHYDRALAVADEIAYPRERDRARAGLARALRGPGEWSRSGGRGSRP
jgi:alkylhydroperoxidase family enzyme